MKFLRSKSLRQIGMIVLCVMAVIYAGEYFLLHYKITALDEAEQKLDFTRKIQLTSQDIQILSQQYAFSDTAVATEIQTRLTDADLQLAILGNGGRLERTDIMLDRLSRLPRISYDNLMDYWRNYKGYVTAMLQTKKDTVISPTVVAVSDSLAADFPASPSKSVSSPNPAFLKLKQKQDALAITLSHWFDNLYYDLENEAKDKKAAVIFWIAFIMVIDLALIILLVFAFQRNILNKLTHMSELTLQRTQIDNLPQNELGQVGTRINEVLENLKDATDFVTAIGQGNLSINYHESLDQSYQKGKNILADSLIDMQGKLKTLNDEERKRQWSNEGLTKFVDILRSSNDDLLVLGDKITSALVQYTRANQGGLYILNDEDENNKHLELISLFAFDIKKFEQRKIKLGEGLLGQTFLERETTYYNNVPDEYIRITSGLGEANPRSILIVPLKVDREVYGIVELASFHEFQPHEISFVEKLGETIASTLSNVRAAQRNRHLIEQFQQQTEEMRAQEEEMRQNMEELQATQEEIARKEKSYINRIRDLEEDAKTKITPKDLDDAKSSLSRAEKQYQAKIQELENQLAAAPQKSDDWEAAEELARTLKINLEALKITQEELDRKA